MSGDGEAHRRTFGAGEFRHGGDWQARVLAQGLEHLFVVRSHEKLLDDGGGSARNQGEKEVGFAL